LKYQKKAKNGGKIKEKAPVAIGVRQQLPTQGSFVASFLTDVITWPEDNFFDHNLNIRTINSVVAKYVIISSTGQTQTVKKITEGSVIVDLNRVYLVPGEAVANQEKWRLAITINYNQD